MNKVISCVGWGAWCAICSVPWLLIAGHQRLAISSLLIACFLIGSLIILKIIERGGE